MIILSTLKKILFWSYERGSWQYDVMCVLILAFILFAPNRVFDQHREETVRILSVDEIGQIDENNPEPAIEARLQQEAGHAVRISRIEKVVDSSGRTSYVVWQK